MPDSMPIPWNDPTPLAWAAYADSLEEQGKGEQPEWLWAYRIHLGLIERPRLVLYGHRPASPVVLGGLGRNFSDIIAPGNPNWLAGWDRLEWASPQEAHEWSSYTMLIEGELYQMVGGEPRLRLTGTPLDFAGMLENMHDETRAFYERVCKPILLRRRKDIVERRWPPVFGGRWQRII